MQDGNASRALDAPVLFVETIDVLSHKDSSLGNAAIGLNMLTVRNIVIRTDMEEMFGYQIKLVVQRSVVLRLVVHRFRSSVLLLQFFVTSQGVICGM